MRELPALVAFNRGLVSSLALARVDQKRVAMSAETHNNWIPRALGYMSLRPGLQYLGRTNSDLAPRYVPFVFATDDTSLVEFTNATMRVWINDVLLARVSVSTSVTNGTFSGNITGWTDGSDAGGTIAWDTGNYLKLTGNGTARAIAYQALSVAAADQAKEHGLHVVIERGPVTIKVGTSLGDDSLIAEVALDTGTHSLAITPNAATVYVQFLSTALYKVRVQQCTIESSGTVTLTSPFLAADLSNIRFDQSGDIIYLACSGYQQRKIERRGTRPGARSWSISVYHTDDGPFMPANLTPATLTASGTTGDITLTASTPVFKSTHVGAIFGLTANSAQQTVNASAENTFTSTSIKVTGTGTQRALSITITGTWVATVTLQQSIGVDGSWSDVTSWTTNQAATPFTDGLDNQIAYYRIGIKTGNYTSGTATCQINYAAGLQVGIARVTAFSSSTSVSAQVLSQMGGTSATSVWAEGYWSDYRGWPTCLRFHEGRLWLAGKNGIWGSVSDSYYSFDQNTLGDSGPIVRTIGSGPVDTVNWILSMQRMVFGTQGSEISARSSALDVPLTPTDFVLKPASTQGSSAVEARRIDQDGIYIDRSGIHVFQLTFDLKNYLYPDYGSTDLTALVPELGSPGIVRMDIQRRPDTRVHCVRSDGTVAVCIMEKGEEVVCWLTVDSLGGSGSDAIEDVVVLPGANGSTDDQVYYAVKRTINGSVVRHLEKWAKETECRGGTQNKQADAFITGTNSPASATISGLTHLVGASVIAWADGIDYSGGFGSSQTTYTVSSTGTITLGTAVTSWVVGLPYNAKWKSSKLGVQPSVAETLLNQHKKLDHLGIVAAYLHPKGIQFGPDFDNLDDLPSIEEGTTVPSNTVRTSYDEEMIAFPGKWSTDERICILGQAPRPATLMALVPDMDAVL